MVNSLGLNVAVSDPNSTRPNFLQVLQGRASCSARTKLRSLISVLVKRGQMYRVASYLSVLCALALAACHTHPLHEDVTGLSTAELVRKIQCEAAHFIKNAHPARNTPWRLEQLKAENGAIEKQRELFNSFSENIPAGMTHNDIDEIQANIKLQAQQLSDADISTPGKKATVDLEINQLTDQLAKLVVIAKAVADRDKAAKDLKK